MERVLLVTARASAGLDDDMPLLVDALSAEGTPTDVVSWDDPDIDWADSSLVMVRSTWDYTTRRDEFLDWARRVGSVARLEHPAGVLAWNTDKRYLAELPALGIGIVPSTFFDPGQEVVLPDEGQFVVKPSVSAGSRDTARFSAGDGVVARSLCEEIHRSGRTVLVQPYVATVDAHGETAMIYFGGEFSHSIRKGPLLALDAAPSRALFAPETITAHRPSPDERRAGAAVIRALGSLPLVGESLHPPLYARVDLVTDEAGAPLVLELELCEPSVFLAFDPGAARRLARAITSVAHGE